ncbi:hypothetical protein DSCA_52210 [Desulfosarcina alkanivorans]|uniref:histidine kinase n=1 Tax=Desulfosarcina alkanivorans TaxID=571177 RepID=A0A5K7YW34_9BACT|nr:PAS domain S-box protein [Desulfosarcina alkanivorans]BBO71291.1 hypothetical protein DSCA_52210 [Desulfosarcina alkanivorans]
MVNGRKPETMYRQLCANMMDAFGAADMEGRVTEANHPFLDLVGYRKGELLGLSIFDLTPSKWHELEQQIIDEQVMVRGYSDVFEKEYRRKDGSIVPVELRVVLARDPDGHPVGMWAIVRDLSVRLAREDALRRFQLSVESSPDAVFWINAEGRFPYVNAHACRSLGYSRNEMMRLHLWDIDVGFSQEMWGPHWEKVRKSGGAGLERQDRRKDGTVFPVEISSKIITFEDQVHHVALTFFPSEDIENIEFDPVQIEQILMNLAVNARDAMPAGGSLTFETANVSLDEAYCREHMGFIPGDFVQISVSDNGIGMDAENLDHIFEPFYTTKEIGKGTGLGLSTVYGIVKQGGGFINGYSEPGRGSTFKIYIPVSRGDTEPLKIDEHQGPVLGSETVFLVEDDEMVRKVTEASLRELGYTVLSVAGPEAALAVFCRQAQ